ncbi:MAG TPA: RdgB/HAM1 family non-canonical purine NTP pyrophosphatase [Candidatus Udaeobacter sp.]|nr:RdgB/HAM1 family non-canonical purine NTP pyrophosphatase [Candidatus Udaeobacter sp.]
MQLILSTRNAHKVREIGQILGAKLTIRGLSSHDHVAKIDESGSSYEENAILKAVTVSQQLPGLIVGDDSGLEVDALGGAPGIYSARYGGANATAEEKIRKLLDELTKVHARGDQRLARFRCVLAVARDGHLLGTFEGVARGKIAEAARGSNGFGYDPIFIPAGFEKTFAELPGEVKNNISHRANAVRKLKSKLRALCEKV